MKDRNQLLVGQIGLEWGLVTREQLAECLNEQSRQERPRPIGVFLVAKGYLKDEQLIRIIDEQRRRMGQPADYAEARKEDILFGKLLVKHGLVTADQVNEALRSQQDLAECGTDRRLGEILVESGRITPAVVRATLAAQGKKVMACPSCGRVFNVVHYAGSRKYRCRTCGMTLEITNETLSVDETAHDDEEVPPAP